QLLVRGFGDFLQAAELPEETLPSGLAYAGDRVQARRHHGPPAQLPVVGNREPVRLITNPLDEMGSGGGGMEDDGILPACQEDPFLFLTARLGQADHGEIRVSDLPESVQGG